MRLQSRSLSGRRTILTNQSNQTGNEQEQYQNEGDNHRNHAWAANLWGALRIPSLESPDNTVQPAGQDIWDRTSPLNNTQHGIPMRPINTARAPAADCGQICSFQTPPAANKNLTPISPMAIARMNCPESPHCLPSQQPQTSVAS